MSPPHTRLFVVHAGQEIGPLHFEDVMSRVRTGTLTIDDMCRVDGAQSLSPLRVVLPKLGPPLPATSRANRSRKKMVVFGAPTDAAPAAQSRYAENNLSADAELQLRRENAYSDAAPRESHETPGWASSTTPKPWRIDSTMLGWPVAGLFALVAIAVIVVKMPRLGISGSATATPVPSASVSQTAEHAVSPAAFQPLPGERFPETRTGILNPDQLRTWPEGDLQYAMNEILARHGAEFTDQTVAMWFRQYSWYHPGATSTVDETIRSLSDAELQNWRSISYVFLIKHQETIQQQKAAAQQKLLAAEQERAVAAQRAQQQARLKEQHRAAAGRNAQRQSALKQQREEAAARTAAGIVDTILRNIPHK